MAHPTESPPPNGPAATITSHSARITAPLSYVASSGRTLHIPVGPCLVENLGNSLVDIVWGERAQSSTALPLRDVQAARHEGHLQLLD